MDPLIQEKDGPAFLERRRESLSGSCTCPLRKKGHNFREQKVPIFPKQSSLCRGPSGCCQGAAPVDDLLVPAGGGATEERCPAAANATGLGEATDMAMIGNHCGGHPPGVYPPGGYPLGVKPPGGFPLGVYFAGGCPPGGYYLRSLFWRNTF